MNSSDIRMIIIFLNSNSPPLRPIPANVVLRGHVKQLSASKRENNEWQKKKKKH